MRAETVAAGLLSIGLGTMGNAETVETLPTYQAAYEAFYRGQRVGRAEFSVTRIAGTAAAYEFRSVSRVEGLLRLLAPNPVVEISEFVYADGRVQPLAYSYEDGSRRGKDNFSIAFDWAKGIAVTTAEGVGVESKLVPGVLDRGSQQAALMLRTDGQGPERYTLLDKDGLEVHEFRAGGEETLETPLGAIATRKFIQQRTGSSRRTLIWMAEELHALPVRIERQAGGETRAAFRLQSVRWLEPLRQDPR